MSLHSHANDSIELASDRVTFEIVPAWTPYMDPAYAALTQSAPRTALTHSPLRFLIFGDSLVFDGMKAFFIDYIKAFTSLGMAVTYIDSLCDFPNTDSLETGATTDDTLVGAAVMAAGARLVRLCVSCPGSLCTRADVVKYSGTLHSAATLSDLPPAWREFVLGLPPLFQQHDVMLVRECLQLLACVCMCVCGESVCVHVPCARPRFPAQLSWHDNFNKDASEPGTLFTSQLAALANPNIVRLVDLGQCWRLWSAAFGGQLCVCGIWLCEAVCFPTIVYPVAGVF